MTRQYVIHYTNKTTGKHYCQHTAGKYATIVTIDRLIALGYYIVKVRYTGVVNSD